MEAYISQKTLFTNMSHTRARWKVLGLTMKDCYFQLKKILLFYLISLYFNTLGPAFLQYQYFFPEVRVWETVKIFIYGPLNFFFGCEAGSTNKFLQVSEEMEVWGSQIRRIGGMSEQIVPHILQFSHCEHTFVSRCVLVKVWYFFLLQARPLLTNFDIQLVKKVVSMMVYQSHCLSWSKSQIYIYYMFEIICGYLIAWMSSIFDC